MRIEFNFDSRSIGIEGDAPELVEILKLAKEIAPKLTSINIETIARQAGSSGGAAAGANGNSHEGSGAGAGGTQSLRQFARGLKLSSIPERIAAIAFYQAKSANTPTFSPKQMGEWFSHCGFQKPEKMAVAVFDTKRKNGFLESAGHGAWKLTTSGENLIVGKIEESRAGE